MSHKKQIDRPVPNRSSAFPDSNGTRRAQECRRGGRPGRRDPRSLRDSPSIRRQGAPVNTDDRLEPLKLLQVVEPVPKALAADAEKVQTGWRDYQEMKTNDVIFLEEPRRETYATVVVFQDLYGNKWDLLQPNTPT